MGNIRQTYIKRVAMELLRKHEEVFTDDFQTNKQLVQELTDIESKELRNRVAGYTTRLIQQDNLILH
ncbi:30S ribosomal protein S17e [Thermoplasmatales archaeon SW_10_69_26]|jgi:small subunit ribosomal protein S17e|nr:MAG: 30S ribosomal protein S17e [Thermoplasmatales archaeon SW_10_69_26]